MLKLLGTIIVAIMVGTFSIFLIVVALALYGSYVGLKYLMRKHAEMEKAKLEAEIIEVVAKEQQKAG